jgi:hypothetical protein
MVNHRRSSGRVGAAALALAGVLTLASCSADQGSTTGPTASGTTTSGSPSPTPTSETTPSDTPTASDTPSPSDEAEAEAVNLCEELDVDTLSQISGLPLRPGTFNGATCVWEARDGSGTLTMSFGEAERTAGYIDRLKDADYGDAVTVAGADDAAAVTITVGANDETRVGVVARVGRDRLTVVLTGENPSVDVAIQIAELVTNA